MNWEMLAAIGQLVAAIGVIPSLVWLAFQIREQNKERRRAGINILTAQWSELVKSAQESREFAVLFLQGVRSFNDLDGPEKIRFTAFFTRSARAALSPIRTTRSSAFDALPGVAFRAPATSPA